MQPIPDPLLVAVLVLIDVVKAVSLAVMFRHRDDAHIVFRGWMAIVSRSVLMLLWIHFTIVGDLGLIPDHHLCPFFAAALVCFYAYLASVSVQFWHTYVCWSSLTVIIGTGNTRLAVLKPPGFLRYRRLLTSTLFQVGLGAILAIAFGGPDSERRETQHCQLLVFAKNLSAAAKDACHMLMQIATDRTVRAPEKAAPLLFRARNN